MIITRVNHHTLLHKQDLGKGTKVHQGTKVHLGTTISVDHGSPRFVPRFTKTPHQNFRRN